MLKIRAGKGNKQIADFEALISVCVESLEGVGGIWM